MKQSPHLRGAGQTLKVEILNRAAKGMRAVSHIEGTAFVGNRQGTSRGFQTDERAQRLRPISGDGALQQQAAFFAI